MYRFGRIISISVVVTGLLLLGHALLTKTEAFGPLQQNTTVGGGLPQPTQPSVPSVIQKGAVPIPSTDTKKCVGDGNAGCCVSGANIVVWGGFNAVNCPK